MTSESSYGLSRVTLQFALDRDIDAARRMVEDGIGALLPHAAEHGVRLAIEHAGENGVVLCYGSLYMIGDIDAALKKLS